LKVERKSREKGKEKGEEKGITTEITEDAEFTEKREPGEEGLGPLIVRAHPSLKNAKDGAPSSS
jgi:hypothetical protein